MQRLKWPLTTLCAAALLAGCANTAYERPALNMPAQWPSLPTASRSAANAAALAQTSASNWWLALDDAQLTALIDLALEKNNNLAAAAYKVRNAQLAAGNAMGNRLPSVSASGSANASKSLHGSNTVSTTLPDGTVVTDTTGAAWQKSFGASASVGWEIDLWGKLAAQQRIADWEASATEQDRQATAQALVGTVAKTYWQIAVIDHRIALQNESLQVAEKTMQMAQVQYDAGAISGLDLAQAKQSYASQLASATALDQQRTELRNALAIVFDAPPGQLPEAAQHPMLPNMAALPAIPAGLPVDMLGRRPDLRAAELRLKASLTQVDVTRVSYYPTLSLTGSLGSSSTVLSQALNNPVGALGLGLALPFLNMGDMQRGIATSRNTYAQAVLTFRQTLYQALAEVDNALSARIQLQQQAAQLQEALTQAQRAETRAETRYRAGATPLKTWLDAQETRRSAQLALQDAQLARLTNLVTLYQALGGNAAVPEIGHATPAAEK